MLWAFKRIDATNNSAFIVAEYFERKNLAELGFRFDDSELTNFEVNCFKLISNELNRLEEAERKKAKTRK